METHKLLCVMCARERLKLSARATFSVHGEAGRIYSKAADRAEAHPFLLQLPTRRLWSERKWIFHAETKGAQKGKLKTKINRKW
jgi:hypothetical protein